MALDEFDRILTTGEAPPEIVDDPNEISREIIMQLLAAETDEQLESFGAAVGWRELEGVPVEIRGFRWRRSDFEEGAAVYVIVNATRLDNGEAVVLTTGSANVMAALSNMARRGTLIGAVRVLERGEKTKAGYYPLWLKTPEGHDNAAPSAA